MGPDQPGKSPVRIYRKDGKVINRVISAPRSVEPPPRWLHDKKPSLQEKSK